MQTCLLVSNRKYESRYHSSQVLMRIFSGSFRIMLLNPFFVPNGFGTLNPEPVFLHLTGILINL